MCPFKGFVELALVSVGWPTATLHRACIDRHREADLGVAHLRRDVDRLVIRAEPQLA